MKPFLVMEILARANELERMGHRVVHMEVGEPDQPPPEAAIKAISRSLNRTTYTPSLGLQELRQAISDYYMAEYEVNVPSDRIVVTTGTSGAFLLAFAALFRPGDRVAVLDPGYPCYPNILEFLGIEPVRIPIYPEDSFKPKLGAVGSLDGILLTSPSNPTGAMLERADYKAFIERVPTVISDEIYQGITLDPEVEIFTAAEFGEDVVVVDGFSKKWSMTGLRLGWLVVPQKLIETMSVLTQNLFICPPTIAQHAGIAVLRECRDEVRRRRAAYRERAEYLMGALERLGFHIPVPPKGAFYLYADVSRICEDSYSFCMELLERAHVAITPGLDFGQNQPERYVRLSLANSLDNLKEGVRRISSWLKSR